MTGWGFLQPGAVRATAAEPFFFTDSDESGRFRFAALPVGGELIFRDRFAWHGPWDSETVRWHVGAGLATGSLFVTGTVAELSRTGEGSLERVVLPLASGDTCIRWCGPPAEVVRELVAPALTQAAHNEPPGLSRRSSSGEITPWFVGTNNLGPTHWFS